MSDIKKSVESVGAGWGDAPWAETYYADPEQQLETFWSYHGHFRPLFERLNLRSAIDLACGRGRHAEIVALYSHHLTLMDIHQTNIDFCKRRLGHYPYLNFVVNSGHDFQPIGDEQATGIYCYDAMVHFSPDIVEAYLQD